LSIRKKVISAEEIVGNFFPLLKQKKTSTKTFMTVFSQINETFFSNTKQENQKYMLRAQHFKSNK
jgi:hypothetical protein